MKKFFACVSMMCLLSAPVSFTSCDEDDVKTALAIVDLFINNTSELAGTQWLAADNSMALVFSDSQNGVLIVATENGQQQQLQFTYTLNQNTLTLNTSAGTYQFTVTGYTAGSTMTLKDASGATLQFNIYTGQ